MYASISQKKTKMRGYESTFSSPHLLFLLPQRYLSLKMAEWRILMFHISPVRKHREKGHYLTGLLDRSTVKHDSWTVYSNYKSIRCWAKKGLTSSAGRSNLRRRRWNQGKNEQKEEEGRQTNTGLRRIHSHIEGTGEREMEWSQNSDYYRKE